MLTAATARNLGLIALLAIAGAPAWSAPAAAIPAAAAIRIPEAVRARIAGSGLIDLPLAWRRENWTGPKRQGSCVHASLAHLLEWQGEHAIAAAWRATHGDGETPIGLAQKLNGAGVRYAETRSGDETFLDWAIRTRRGAAVVVENGAHMVNLVGLDAREAHILDSNSPTQIGHFSRAAFLADWRQSGGWAFTLLAGAPTPPDPWLLISASKDKQK